MKLLEQYEAACRLRHFAEKTRAVYAYWVLEFLRFHRVRLGKWQHPAQLGVGDIEAFLGQSLFGVMPAGSTWRLLESGYDIRTVQQLLGHKHVETTMIYTHVMARPGVGARSLLDSQV